MVSFVIPTTKTFEYCKEQINAIRNIAISEHEIIHTGINQSAAKNRNAGLNRAVGDIIIMLDDDITGFYKGWDRELISELSGVAKIISARLKNTDGSWQDTIGDVKDYETHIVETKDNIIPSACIAFRKTDMRFNEDYKGAGFEDTSYCLRMTKDGGKVVINNRCVLIHKNEKKNQDDYFAYNREVFRKEFNLSHSECYKYH